MRLTVFTWLTILGSATAATAAPIASTTDVSAYSTAIPGMTSLGFATQATGSFSGNDTGAMGTALTKLNTENLFSTGLTWMLADKSDDPTPDYFANNPGTPTGTLSLSQALDGPFVLSLKAANNYSLYYFDGTFQDVLSFEFTTIGTAQNPQGAPQGLSHASLFLPQSGGNGGGGGNGNGGGGGSGNIGDTPIPEPATLAVFGGIALVGAVGYRRRRATATA